MFYIFYAIQNFLECLRKHLVERCEWVVVFMCNSRSSMPRTWSVGMLLEEDWLCLRMCHNQSHLRPLMSPVRQLRCVTRVVTQRTTTSDQPALCSKWGLLSAEYLKEIVTELPLYLYHCLTICAEFYILTLSNVAMDFKKLNKFN